VINVLIIDDDYTATRIHSSYVRQLPGFNVVGAALTGEAALKRARSLRPDLVLLDIRLPDINGLDLLPRLREINPALDALVLTGSRDVGTVRRALRGGIVHYLMKPFNGEDLRDRLEHYRQAYRLPVAPADAIDQRHINRIFQSPRSNRPLPPHCTSETLQMVERLVQEAETHLSATETAKRLGISRVSARRYLEYLKDTGRADVRLNYGIGRPERLYVWR
jgi:response regulator of citrate/malate metabolism